MKISTWIAIGSALTIVIVGSIMYHRGKRSKELTKQQHIKDMSEIPVTLAKVELKSFRTTIPFTGNLLAVNRAELKAEVTGRLTRVAVQEGDRVGRDSVLSAQDEEDLLLGVQAAEAQFVQATAQAEQATRDFDRAKQLLEKSSITKQAEQQAETMYTAAMAGARAAESNLGLAKSRLHKAQIRSPFEGQVARSYVKVGEMLNPGQPAFSIVDNRRMEIEADLPAENIGLIRTGLRVIFFVHGFETSFEGRVANVAPALVQDGRTLRVRIEVPNEDGRLKSGLFAEGEIISGQVLEKPALPSNVLTVAGKSADVYIAENTIARLKRITIGYEQQGWRPIEKNGLMPGEFIVAQGRDLVSEGMRIRVVEIQESQEDQNKTEAPQRDVVNEQAEQQVN
ncbi:MAG: efflux RND transporter periplasmic adaptor subunit [Holophagales bacterium]|jgi:RND family efflux transporter MFP subunit|nr:efflux RND transporter periplasmic adaptor subunit [Holophagales bacterium]